MTPEEKARIQANNPEMTDEYLAQRAAFEAKLNRLPKPTQTTTVVGQIVAPAAKAPKGYFSLNKYHLPKNIGREEYLRVLLEDMQASDWPHYGPYTSPRVVHRERIDSLNFYHPDLLRILENFFSYYGDSTLYVVNGFRSPQELGATPHSLGIAIDIEATSNAESYRIMNAAYMAGFPTIIPGGDFLRGEGYIHLDLAPTAEHNYGAGNYDGPWS